jgi:hypothetical protein
MKRNIMLNPIKCEKWKLKKLIQWG